MIIKINILFTKKSKKKKKKKKNSKIINKSLDCNISWINDILLILIYATVQKDIFLTNLKS